MEPAAVNIVRIIFFLLFLATFFGGLFVMKHYERLFGYDPDHPNETSGSRAYGKMQALVVWLHAMVLTGAFAFMAH